MPEAGLPLKQLWVVANPSPQALNAVADGYARPPAQLALGLMDIADEDVLIAHAPIGMDDRDLAFRQSGENRAEFGPDRHGVVRPAAQVVYLA